MNYEKEDKPNYYDDSFGDYFENEIWKPIRGFDKFNVSNFGRVKQVSTGRVCKELYDDNDNTCSVGLYNEHTSSLYRVHTLVFNAFSKRKVNHRKLMIKHIDGNNSNNMFRNLKLTTIRENVINSRTGLNKFTGVIKSKHKTNALARIQHEGNIVKLGRFNCETRASLAYDRECKKYINELINK
tara:strand:- start:3395 stop:3946 length:552 start_codon:yes stop_codon:yes gene_type:complete